MCYTVGQKLDITQAKQSQDAEKKFLPFVRYNEYTLDGKAGEQLFSLKVTTGTPQTTPKIEYSQVSGTTLPTEHLREECTHGLAHQLSLWLVLKNSLLTTSSDGSNILF